MENKISENSVVTIQRDQNHESLEMEDKKMGFERRMIYC